MRNYIILNGKNSNEIAGLLIQNLPPISKPLQRTLVEEIDGRDGDIVTKLGYGAYDKEFSIGLYGNYDVDQVISYFNSEGVVTFSNEPDKYYNYQIIDQIDFERLIRFKTAIVRMHVQPFKYLKDEEQIQVDAQNLSGEGTDIKLEYTTKDASLKIEPKGNTHQDSYTGKNLFDNVYGQNMNVYTKNIVANNPLGSVDCYPINLLPNTQYTLKVEMNGYQKNSAWIAGMCFANGEFISLLQYGTMADVTTTTFTTDSTGVVYVGHRYGHDSDRVKLFLQTAKIQIEKGSTATEFEKFVGGSPSPSPDYPQQIEVVTGDNTINVHGKNLLDISKVQVGKMVGIALNEPLTLLDASNWTTIVDYIPAEYGKTYTMSRITKTNGQFIFAQFDNNLNMIVRDNISLNNTNYVNYTINNQNTKYLVVGYREDYAHDNIQLEEGNQATAYEPYQSKDYEISLGNIELCKIGDYQDYIYKENNKWYLHKEIGKVVLNGSESNWAKSGASTTDYFVASLGLNGEGIYSKSNSGSLWLTNRFSSGTGLGGASNENRFYTYNPDTTWGYRNIGFTASASLFSDITSWKTWLSTHNTIVYYPLATPTNTEITDTTLIEQLEALDQAKTIEETTYISSSSESNLPFLLTASAKGMNNTIIENIGNIFAKPIITIYGSGEIAVYLDKVQILQIDLADSGSITIDVSKLEAYNKNTNELMNRSVIGDYSNLKIQCGENELTFSGNVTGFTMDKYTRWL